MFALSSRTRITLVAFAFSVVLTSSARAVVTFDTGLSHTIDGTGTLATGSPIAKDIVDTNGGTAAEVEDAAGPTPTTLELTTGGTISVNTSGAGSGAGARGVNVRNTSTFIFSGGTLDVRDNGGGGNAIGIGAFNSSTVNITGTGLFRVRDAGNDNAIAVWVPDGHSPLINLSGTIDLVRDTGRQSAIGILLGDVSGTITGASANVVVTSTGKIMSVSETDNEAALGIWARGSSNTSTVDFAGSIALSEGPNNQFSDTGWGMRAEGSSKFDVSGSIRVTEVGAGNAIGVETRNSAVANILPGFDIGISESNAGSPRLLKANGGTINIFGGNLQNQLNANQRHIEAAGSGVVNFYLLGGTTFTLDGGTLITENTTLESGDLTGFDSITGTLFDGSTFSNLLGITNSNAETNLIFLYHAPEPSTITLCTLALLMFGAVRRRRRQ